MESSGLFFGSFNPPHIGHLNLVIGALNSGQFKEIIVIPAYQNPWKLEHKEASNSDRLNMTSLMFSDIPGVTVSGVESENHDEILELYGGSEKYNKNSPIYTCQTLKFMKEKMELVNPVIILTPETYNEIRLWKDEDKIMEENKFFLISTSHLSHQTREIKNIVGSTCIDDINISSTRVRKIMDSKKVAIPFVTKEVYNYIESRQLYGVETD